MSELNIRLTASSSASASGSGSSSSTSTTTSHSFSVLPPLMGASSLATSSINASTSTTASHSFSPVPMMAMSSVASGSSSSSSSLPLFPIGHGVRIYNVFNNTVRERAVDATAQHPSQVAFAQFKALLQDGHPTMKVRVNVTDGIVTTEEGGVTRRIDIVHDTTISQNIKQAYFTLKAAMEGIRAPSEKGKDPVFAEGKKGDQQAPAIAGGKALGTSSYSWTTKLGDLWRGWRSKRAPSLNDLHAFREEVANPLLKNKKISPQAVVRLIDGQAFIEKTASHMKAKAQELLQTKEAEHKAANAEGKKTLAKDIQFLRKQIENLDNLDTFALYWALLFSDPEKTPLENATIAWKHLKEHLKIKDKQSCDPQLYQYAVDVCSFLVPERVDYVTFCRQCGLAPGRGDSFNASYFVLMNTFIQQPNELSRLYAASLFEENAPEELVNSLVAGFAEELDEAHPRESFSLSSAGSSQGTRHDAPISHDHGNSFIQEDDEENSPLLDMNSSSEQHSVSNTPQQQVDAEEDGFVLVNHGREEDSANGTRSSKPLFDGLTIVSPTPSSNASSNGTQNSSFAESSLRRSTYVPIDPQDLGYQSLKGAGDEGNISLSSFQSASKTTASQAEQARTYSPVVSSSSSQNHIVGLPLSSKLQPPVAQKKNPDFSRLIIEEEVDSDEE